MPNIGSGAANAAFVRQRRRKRLDVTLAENLTPFLQWLQHVLVLVKD